MTPGLIELDLNGRSPRDVYRLLIGLVIPRPIAWVTTRDKQGRANAAPFSFFNVMAGDPPLVVLGFEARRDVDAHKDTTTNILENEAFIVHVVDRAHAEAMNCTAVDVPPEVDELAVRDPHAARIQGRRPAHRQRPRIAGMSAYVTGQRRLARRASVLGLHGSFLNLQRLTDSRGSSHLPCHLMAFCATGELTRALHIGLDSGGYHETRHSRRRSAWTDPEGRLAASGC
jgi:flavin reductase (DIM6/NTAB) family NADH-FMN oxidoreductase RutF